MDDSNGNNTKTVDHRKVHDQLKDVAERFDRRDLTAARLSRTRGILGALGFGTSTL